MEQVLTGHSGPVTCLATLHLPPPKSTNEIAEEEEEVAVESAPSFTTLIASGSADSSLILWERKDCRSKKKRYKILYYRLIAVILTVR